jgi:hypothetical protein
MDAGVENVCEKLFFSRLLYECQDSRKAVHALVREVPEVSRLEAERLVAAFEKKLTTDRLVGKVYSELCSTSTSSNGGS